MPTAESNSGAPSAPARLILVAVTENVDMCGLMVTGEDDNPQAMGAIGGNHC
jgi:hypothetical protein